MGLRATHFKERNPFWAHCPSRGWDDNRDDLRAVVNHIRTHGCIGHSVLGAEAADGSEYMGISPWLAHVRWRRKCEEEAAAVAAETARERAERRKQEKRERRMRAEEEVERQAAAQKWAEVLFPAPPAPEPPPPPKLPPVPKPDNKFTWRDPWGISVAQMDDVVTHMHVDWLLKPGQARVWEHFAMVRADGVRDWRAVRARAACPQIWRDNTRGLVIFDIEKLQQPVGPTIY